MSADADRSSYRYTKDVISDRYDHCFSQYVDFNSVEHVLDVGSNRGAFINYLEQRYPGKDIVGVEPDPGVVDSYIDLPNVTVQVTRFENSDLPENKFDFAYCAHTLEHADSARGMLLGIRWALRPGGLLFIAVPNLIYHSDVIEELFIDPHTYHFNFHVLKNFASQMGFEVDYSGDPGDPELMLLLRKIEKEGAEFEYFPGEESAAKRAKAEVENYSLLIHQNREAIKDAVSQLNSTEDGLKTVIWGGGRIFDALVKFGGLDLSKVHRVVDKYLYKYESALYGCPLVSPDALVADDPDSLLVYIASRDYADEIRCEAEAFGITRFIQFGQNASL